MTKSIAQIFIEEAIKTESPITPELIERLTSKRTIRLLHASMGLITEGAEILDALKKYIFYGKELDIVNLKEESGDSNWYQAIIHDELDSTFEEVMIKVIQKLRKRYHEGNFDSNNAINRDLNKERSELEKEIDLANGFGMGSKKLAESLATKIDNIGGDQIVNRIKMEIINPIIHWLDDVNTLEVACKFKEDIDKYTLELERVTCFECRKVISDREHNKTSL